MKKILSGVTAAIVLLSTQAQANSGDFTFKGAVNEAACEVRPGSNAGGVTNAIEVDLGTVPLDSLGSGETIGSQKTAFTLDVVCTAGTETVASVHMAFDPRAGSGTGLDPFNNTLLGLENPGAVETAKGVGIGLFDASDVLVKLDRNEKISAPFTSGAGGAGTATLSMQVAYMLNGDPTPAPGKGDAFLPFTLTYE